VDPVEFIVVGTPVSHQARRREALRSWMATVEEKARLALAAGPDPVGEPVEVLVVYYHDEGAANLPDEDNLLKPIQDAMQGIVYADDTQVRDGTCSKRNLDAAFKVRRMSPVLADGFVQGEEFVYIKVSPAPDPEDLRQ
jgi:hypothetical protein